MAPRDMLRLMPRAYVNWLIVAGLALAVTVLPVMTGTVTMVLMVLIQLLVMLGLGWFGYQLWRNNRTRLQYLNGRQRLTFYGALVVLVAVLLLSFVSSLLWGAGLFTTIVLLAIVGVCAFVMYWLWQDAAGWY